MDEMRLKQIEERAARASVGPWAADGHGDMIWGPRQGDGQRICDIRGHGFLTAILKLSDEEAATQQDCDGKFIASSRQDVPDLVAEVRKLNFQVGEMRETLTWVKGNHANPCLGHGSLPCPICMAIDKTLTEKQDVPVPIRPGCICGPEGMCDYHRMTDTTIPIKQVEDSQKERLVPCPRCGFFHGPDCANPARK